ncbi:universal stress protein [Paractinoplanes hotanensis]|uniref:Universal stress protein n=1 Tax=Paractinoplanes hotanensis TaxID=2906497 RepID=A0ABT0YFL4_9ACTN|nr:universal stress protein [Actinoplanes hotanensis]MCM4084852.1 universal stress protein [Actinoplanes hotanensis]
MITRKIIVGYDRSPRSKVAADWALDEAARTGATVEFLYAYEWPAWAPAASMIPSPAVLPEEQIRRAIDDALAKAVAAAAETHPEVRTTAVTRDAGAALTLIDRSRGADLVVVGSHGYSAVSGLLGSVSVAVSAHAHCPVVVVRGRPDAHGPVVAGIDESPASHAVLGVAFDQAAARGTGLRVIRAWPPAAGIWDASPVSAGTVPAGLRHPFDELVNGWCQKFPQVHVTTHAVIEHPAAMLTDESRTAGLLVVGTHGRGSLRGLLLGSVSQHLLRHSSCPVVVAHETTS